MFRIHACILFALFAVWCPCNVYSANVEWNCTSLSYYGFDYTGTQERYTMWDPYLRMTAQRQGTALVIWAEAEANLVSANTFIEVYYIPGRWLVNEDFIYNTPQHFAYAVYDDNSPYGGVWHEDYPIVIDQGDTVYLAFASQSGRTADPVTFGWVQLGLDKSGNLTTISSAWDHDGDPLIVGAIPEPCGGVLLLAGGALLALRRRRRRSSP